MFNPVVSYDFEGKDDRFCHADVPEVIDYVVITHNHQDHVMFEALLDLRHRIKTVIVPRSGGGSLADPSLKLILQNVGFKDVREIGEMETMAVERRDAHRRSRSSASTAISISAPRWATA